MLWCFHWCFCPPKRDIHKSWRLPWRISLWDSRGRLRRISKEATGKDWFLRQMLSWLRVSKGPRSIDQSDGFLWVRFHELLWYRSMNPPIIPAFISPIHQVTRNPMEYPRLFPISQVHGMFVSSWLFSRWNICWSRDRGFVVNFRRLMETRTQCIKGLGLEPVTSVRGYFCILIYLFVAS